MKEAEAARAVLLEVLNALGAMRDDLVIVGGWVPDLLYPSSNHMGSLDVDLAVSPKAIGGNAYSSIRRRLTQLGYGVLRLVGALDFLRTLIFWSDIHSIRSFATRRSRHHWSDIELCVSLVPEGVTNDTAPAHATGVIRPSATTFSLIWR